MLIAKKVILFLFILCFFSVFIYTEAQEAILPSNISAWTTDSATSVNDTTLVVADSISIPADSIKATPVDSIDTPKKKAAIEAKVDYRAKDSIIMAGNHIIHLYGDANVKYQSMELTAEYIEVNMDSSTVYATFGLDSIGDEFGYPVFKDGDSEYESKTMKYNFKTKKGYSTDGITQEGEGYITAGRAKKMEDNVMYMAGGKYTTCDNHDCPHFHLQVTKMKLRHGKDVVAGPAYLVVADVPLPIALPFAFFPFTGSYSSGILMPSYGDEMTRGFYLRDGGYYFAINDYMDMAVTGEIYTKGSWGLSTRSSYRKRYKYSGGFNIGYLTTVTGDKGIDYFKTNDFKINWNHSQDPKSNPYRVLSANVNFSSTSYDRNQLNSIYNPSLYTSNTKASSVTYTQRFPDSPWTVSANMSASQNSKDSMVSVTLPSMTISMATVFPLRRKHGIGKERWYEKISFTYNGSLQNNISTKEDKLFKSNIVKDWNNGFTHNIPVSATFNLFKYLNITPSFSYKESWNSSHILREYDIYTNQLVPTDTVWGFNRVYDYNASLGFNTKLYGFFEPLPIFGDKIQTIRHVFTPSISLSAKPDFGSSMFGFYREVTYIDREGEVRSQWYSPYKNAPSRGKSGYLNFSVQNNLEMKVKSDADSTGVKKISLIDNLSLNGGYNLMADSMKWTDFNLAIRLKLSKSFTLNLNGTLDPYTYRTDGTKQDRMRWEDGKGFARLRRTGTSFSYTFNTESIKKLWSTLTGGKSEEENAINTADEASTGEGESLEPENESAAPEQRSGSLRKKKESSGDLDADGYIRTNIPWSLSFNYGLQLDYDMSREKFNPVKREYPYKITQNLGFSGNITPTPGWNLSFTTSYDFDSKKLVYMNCNVSRNLHCWSMSAGVIPIGPYKSYNFTISVNSSLLQDLKYEQSSNSRDAMRWY